MIDEFEKKLIEKEKIDIKKYEMVTEILEHYSNTIDIKHEKISFIPIKDRINRYLFRKKLSSLGIILLIYAFLFDLFFLKDILMWTKIATSMNYFFIYIFSKWIIYLGNYGFKFLRLLCSFLLSPFLPAVIVLLLTPFLIIKFKKKNI
jgi:hypothetical protein